MRAKRIIAFLILQVYLVAAFGLTVKAKVCCEEKPASEVAHACHQDKTPHSTTIKEQHLDCIFCSKESEPAIISSCCDDCLSLTIKVAEDHKLNEVATPSAKVVQKEIFQPTSIELFGLNPKFFDEIYFLATSLFHREISVKNHSVPLYIKNCIYRI